MENNSNFDAFLYLSSKKIILSINQIQNFKSIYKNEILLNSISDEIDHIKLDNFLNNNIFKVEKILDDFIKNINVLIETKDLFTVNISVKKNNHNKIIDIDSIIYLLNDAKNLCDKTIHGKKIIHILIDNYLVDDIKYYDLPDNLSCENFSLDLSFICLSNNFIKKIEEVLKRYQISINQLLSAAYVKKFIENKDVELFDIARRIINGYNKNEVKLVRKKTKNRAFFEKFFDFFS
tara:strand:+ start:317 stop:1021 length:705 start_codon:yes stop_codon:yes gene_type:complete